MPMIEQTREEREVMYMKVAKKELVEMLMHTQDALTNLLDLLQDKLDEDFLSLIHRQPPRWQDRAGAELGGQLGCTDETNG